MKPIGQAVAAALRAARVERDARLNISTITRNSPKGVALAALAISMSLSAPGWAQDADSSSGASSPSLDEVTVTGSRIKRTTDFDTPNPTTVVDSSYLQNLGIVNVGAAI